MFVYICPKTLDSIHQKLVNNGVVKKSVSKQKVLESPLNRLVKNSCLKTLKKHRKTSIKTQIPTWQSMKIQIQWIFNVSNRLSSLSLSAKKFVKTKWDPNICLLWHCILTEIFWIFVSWHLWLRGFGVDLIQLNQMTSRNHRNLLMELPNPILK